MDVATMRLSLRQVAAGGRSRLREALAGLVDRPFMPIPADDTDLFLVSYPKSGVNWLKWLMATANLRLSGDPREITFFNHSDFIADLHSVRRVGPPGLAVPGCRCFTSHAPWMRRYRKVIYIVRDPRHVMPSYHTHLTSRGAWQGTLEQLVAHEQYGIRAWASHVGGWLDRVDATASFTLLRYEDLRARTAEELIRIYALLGWRLDAVMATQVVAEVSPQRMREDEARFNEGHPKRRGTEFVRKGAFGGPRQPVPAALLGQIEAEAGPLMRRLGYLGGEAETTSARGRVRLASPGGLR
jgi:hypothetical protein